MLQSRMIWTQKVHQRASLVFGRLITKKARGMTPSGSLSGLTASS